MKARRMTPYLVAGLVVQRLLEVRRARANERWARERGAVEYGQEHYWLFYVLHPAWLLSLLREGRASRRDVNWPAFLVFLALQPLRSWVMRTLGHYWNTKILIVPGGKRVTGGPFRYLSHPNYAVVAAELLSAPLAVRAPRTALVFSLLNAALLLGIRIPAEERALTHYRAQTEAADSSG